ncbi:MAG: hypothetical protein ACRDIE_24075 [Chloroflexota bacterium]
MTKKSDMASRYAAAHARREQRRREAPVREFLPLADEPTGAMQPNATGAAPTAGGRVHFPSLRGDAVLTSRVPAMDYSYLRADLLRTLVLAVILFAAMIIISFFI